MPLASKDTIAAVLAASDCRRVLGMFTGLTVDAESKSMRCPLPGHNDGSPSFSIRAKSFKCFANCQGDRSSGNALVLYQVMSGQGFREALEALASAAGIAIDGALPAQRRPSVAQPKAPAPTFNGLGAATKLALTDEQASKAICAELACHLPGSAAEQMLRERGISKDTQTKFGLGFWSRDCAVGSNAIGGLQPAINLGLMRYDEEKQRVVRSFAGRLTIPLRDLSGNALGFAGRLVPGEGQEGAAKYINSRASQDFCKGAFLFGLDQAIKGIERTRTAIAVEGYFDCMHLHQLGYSNAVAYSSSLLTHQQLAMLFSLADDLLIVADNDEAGKRTVPAALQTALPLLSGPKRLHLSTLPPVAKDVAAAVEQGMVEDLRSAVAASRCALSYLLIERSYDKKARRLNLNLSPEELEFFSQAPAGATRESVRTTLHAAQIRELTTEPAMHALFRRLKWLEFVPKQQNPFARHFISPVNRRT